MLKRYLKPAFIVALLLAGAASGGPPGSAKAVLEETIRSARRDLPKRAPDFGRAAQQMAELDPARAAELIREAIRLARKEKWTREQAEYYMIQSPLGTLAGKDLELAGAVALEEPGRLLPLFSGALATLYNRDPQAAVRFGRTLMQRAPREGADLIFLASRQYSGNPPRDLILLIPAGPRRAALLGSAGVSRLASDRAEAVLILRQAVAEAPEGRSEVDQGLFGQGRSDYPRLPQKESRQASPAEWRRLADTYRDLPSEAGLAGLASNLAHQDKRAGTALEIARSIREPEMRCLALARFDRCPDAAVKAAALREAAALFPQVTRLMLRASIAESLGGAARGSRAVGFYLAGIEAVRRAPAGHLGIFGTDDTYSPRADILASFCGMLAGAQPARARSEAHRLRALLAAHYRGVILHCVASEPDGKTALGWLRADLGGGERVLHDYAILAADAHPENVAALVRTLPPGYRRDVLLVRLVPATAVRSVQAAVGLAPLFASPTARSAAYREAVQSAYRLGWSTRLELAARIPLPLIRADATLTVLQGDGVPRAEARRIAAAMADCGPKWEAMKDLAADLPPREALVYAAGIHRYTERVEAQKRALTDLAAKNPNQALDWITRAGDAETRTDLLTAVGEQVAGSDPEGALRLARRLEHRGSREAVVGAVIRRYMNSRLDRALELSGEIVLRNNRRMLIPPLLGRALKARKSPGQVWPLYRWASRDVWELVGAWSWRESSSGEGAMLPSVRIEQTERLDPFKAVQDITITWMTGFPRETWLPALKANVGGTGETGIDPWFLHGLAARLAESRPTDAIALVEGCDLGDPGWESVIHALEGANLQQAAALYDRLKTSEARLRTAARYAARSPAEPVWKSRARDAAGARMREAAAAGTAVEQAGALLQVARELKSAGLDPGDPLRLARAAAVRITDPFERSRILKRIEEMEGR